MRGCCSCFRAVVVVVAVVVVAAVVVVCGSGDVVGEKENEVDEKNQQKTQREIEFDPVPKMNKMGS